MIGCTDIHIHAIIVMTMMTLLDDRRCCNEFDARIEVVVDNSVGLVLLLLLWLT